MIIVNDDSRVVNKLEASLTNDARVIIYDPNMCIVQAIGLIFAGKTGAYQSGALISAPLNGKLLLF